MSFLEFQQIFSHLPVISVVEIEKAFPGFDRNALTRWQKKGYLEKIRRGFYRLAQEQVKGDAERSFIANRIYSPSYISLESALRWYDFIPEGVFTITSVSTLKTLDFNSSAGHFSYRHIKSDLFWGYRLEEYGTYGIKIAEPAKALLDFLYLHTQLNTADHFFELRFNLYELKERINWTKFDLYLKAFASKALQSRAQSFIKFLHNHAVTF